MKNRHALKVLHLASWYPNVDEPQDGNFIARHISAIHSYAESAVVFVKPRKGIKEYELITSDENGVFTVVVYYPKSARYSYYQKYKRYFKACQMGYDAAVAHLGEVDILHLHVSYFMGLFALRLKKKLQIPLVVTEHWTAFLPIGKHRFSFIEKYIIPKVLKTSDAVSPVSYSLANSMQSFASTALPIHVIDNVVDTKLFYYKKGESTTDKFTILHVSTCNDAHKNITGMLHAFKQIKCFHSKRRNKHL